MRAKHLRLAVSGAGGSGRSSRPGSRRSGSGRGSGSGSGNKKTPARKGGGSGRGRGGSGRGRGKGSARRARVKRKGFVASLTPVGRVVHFQDRVDNAIKKFSQQQAVVRKLEPSVKRPGETRGAFQANAELQEAKGQLASLKIYVQVFKMAKLEAALEDEAVMREAGFSSMEDVKAELNRIKRRRTRESTKKRRK